MYRNQKEHPKGELKNPVPLWRSIKQLRQMIQAAKFILASGISCRFQEKNLGRMGLTVNISLKLKDVGELSLISTFLWPLSIHVQYKQLVKLGVGENGTQVWEEGWVQPPHGSFQKSTILNLEQVVDDGDTHVAWKPCRLESSEDALEWTGGSR